jgi:hypothetical protein
MYQLQFYAMFKDICLSFKEKIEKFIMLSQFCKFPLFQKERLKSLIEKRIPMKYIKILARGSFGKNDLKVFYRGRTRTPVPEIDQLIQERWEAEVKKVEQRKIQKTDGSWVQGELKNGPLLRFDGYEKTFPPLEVYAGKTDYRDYMGATEKPELSGKYSFDALPNPLGNLAVLATSDGKIVFRRKSYTSGVAHQRFHTFGRAWNPDAYGLEPWTTMKKSLEEVVLNPRNDSLLKDSIQDMKCFGLVFDEYWNETDFCYGTNLKIDSEELGRRYDRIKVGDLIFVDKTASALSEALKEYQKDFIPCGLANLALFAENELKLNVEENF